MNDAESKCSPFHLLPPCHSCIVWDVTGAMCSSVHSFNKREFVFAGGQFHLRVYIMEPFGWILGWRVKSVGSMSCHLSLFIYSKYRWRKIWKSLRPGWMVAPRRLEPEKTLLVTWLTTFIFQLRKQIDNIWYWLYYSWSIPCWMTKTLALCLRRTRSVLRLMLDLGPALWWLLVSGQNMDVNPCILQGPFDSQFCVQEW